MSKFVALEIGNKVTKIIYGIDKKNDVVIKDYKFIENTDKIFNPDGDLNINEIQPLLKTVFKEMKIRRADCYLTVGGQSGIVRLREMPLVKLKEMKEIVRFEAEQFLPYNIEAFYIDFRVNQIINETEMNDMGESKETGTSIAEVMIVAAPKESVDEQVALVDKLHLNIKRVDYYTDAVYCFFKRHILRENTNTLVVDLGSNGMKLTMFSGKQYFANIFSEVGLEDLYERYSEQNNVTIEEAREKIMLNKADLSTQKTEVADTAESIHSKLNRLREKMQFKTMESHNQNTVDFEIDSKLERIYEPLCYEVSKMMEFFKTRQFGMNVSEIYLIGGGSNLDSFSNYLSYYHNIDVHFVDSKHVGNEVDDFDCHLMVPVVGSLLKGGC